MNSRSALVAACGLALVAAAGFGGSAASGAAPDQQGWWTTANPGSVMGSPSPPAPPDVPAKGLLIEGSPTSASGASDSAPSAFGALVYQVPSGSTVGDLTLKVAPNSGTTPTAVLELCPLSNAAIPAEQGGPMNDAPTFSCKTNVTAGPSSSGNSYTFHVSSLVSDGSLAVAILPTAPVDRIVVAQPDDSSLPVQQSFSDTPPPVASGDPASSPAASSAPVASSGQTASNTAASGSPVAASTAGAPTAVTPAATAGTAASSMPAAAAPALAAQGSSSTTVPASASTSGAASAPVATQFTASTDASPAKANPVAVVVLVAALVIGGAIWMAVGRAASRSAAGSAAEPAQG